jgi:hypothetical protein
MPNFEYGQKYPAGGQAPWMRLLQEPKTRNGLFEFSAKEIVISATSKNPAPTRWLLANTFSLINET